MIEDRIVVLSPLATAMLSAMGSDWVEVSGLAADLGRVFGAPPDGVPVVEANEEVLQCLAHDGVLEITGWASTSAMARSVVHASAPVDPADAT